MAVRVAVGVSDELDPVEAFASAARTASDHLGASCDLALVFASAEHLAESEQILAPVHEELDPGALIGCGAGGVLGGGRELEAGPGAVVWALAAPDGRIAAHRLTATAPADDEHDRRPARSGQARRGRDSAGRPVHVQRGGAAGEAPRESAGPAGPRRARERGCGWIGAFVLRRRGGARRCRRSDPHRRRDDPVRFPGRDADRS